MKKVIFAMAMTVATALHAQTINVNNNDGTYLPLETRYTAGIEFNENTKVVTLTTYTGEKHHFHTGKVESISPKADKTTELKYNLEPTVIFDDNDRNLFNEVIETIPTTETDDNDYGDFVDNYKVATVVEIVFSDNDVKVTGDIPYKKNGAHLTIESTVGKIGYIVSGKSANGSLKIYSEKKFQIMLSGLELTNPVGPAINIQTGKTVYFTIDDNTTNSLCDGATYNAPAVADEDQKGTIFSEGQIIFNGYEDGSGILNVTSHGGHGICSDDYIRIRSGNINILSAAKDGFHTNDRFVVGRTATASPRISVNSTADGIDCGKGEVIIEAGILELNTGGEAIKVEYEEENPDPLVIPNATIDGGFIKFTTNGKKSSGIKTTGEYIQNGGIVQGIVKGDGSKILNCDSNITFKGGRLTGFAEGTVLNDTTSAGGIKCEGNINIQDCTIAIACSGKGAKGINSKNTTIKSGDITILTTAENFKGNEGTRKSIAVDTGNFSITNGNIRLKAYDNAISATKTSIFKGTLHAISESDIAIDATISQTGGWIMTKDGK